MPVARNRGRGPAVPAARVQGPAAGTERGNHAGANISQNTSLSGVSPSASQTSVPVQIIREVCLEKSRCPGHPPRDSDSVHPGWALEFLFSTFIPSGSFVGLKLA